MYNLNYNQLYYFFIVANVGSIKEACKILHLTQPSISAGIKNLEINLGVKLFNRGYRKLTLNSHGKLIYRKTEIIFNMGEELLKDIAIVKSRESKAFSKHSPIFATEYSARQADNKNVIGNSHHLNNINQT